MSDVREEHRGRTRLAEVGGVAFVAVALLTVLLTQGRHMVDEFLGHDPAARTQAEAWVLANLPQDARLVVDEPTHSDLVARGIDAGYLVTASSLRDAFAVGGDWTRADFAVSTQQVRSQARGQLAALLSSSTVVASFGDGGDRVDVLEVAPHGPAVAADRQRRVDALSIELGRQVATSTAIRLSAGARSELSTGDVDLRLLAVLTGLARQHTLTVADFFDPDPGGLFPINVRGARIVEVDGVTVATGAAPTTDVQAWLDAQQPPFRPARVSVAAGRIDVEYRVLGPHEPLLL